LKVANSVELLVGLKVILYDENSIELKVANSVELLVGLKVVLSGKNSVELKVFFEGLKLGRIVG
jgi:hypothetical protein